MNETDLEKIVLKLEKMAVVNFVIRKAIHEATKLLDQRPYGDAAQALQVLQRAIDETEPKP